MNKTISLIRIAILLVIGSIATVLIFCEEQDETIFDFLFHVLVDKVLGVAFIFYAGRLYKRWSKVDPWIKDYNKKLDEVMDKPNPTQM